MKNPLAASDHWLGLYNNIFSKWAYSADNHACSNLDYINVI